MPLIIEDGTGVPDANSYGSVAEADAFFADRNIMNWAGAGATTPPKEGYLIEAADYIQMFFTVNGDPLTTDQAMGLPTDVYDYVPEAFKKAQFLLAKERAETGPLYTTLGSAPVTSERKQLQGVGEKEVHYGRSNVDLFGRVGSAVLGLLGPYVRQAGSIQQARVDLA